MIDINFIIKYNLNNFGGVNEKDYSKIAKMYMQDYLKGTTKLTSNDEAIIDRTGINKYTNQISIWINERAIP